MNYPAAILRAKAVADRHAPGSFVAKSAPDKVSELYIYDAIGEGMFGGGVSAKAVVDALAKAKGSKELRVYINSPGGDVFDGVAIYNAIRRFDGKRSVFVDGIAASAASLIAMAGDTVSIAHNGMLMIHQAWGMAIGNADDLRETADVLEKVSDAAMVEAYMTSGQTREKVCELMKAETWMTAEESVSLGFADSIVEADAPSAKAMAPALAAYRNTPASLSERPIRLAAAVAHASQAEILRTLGVESRSRAAGGKPPAPPQSSTNTK